MQRSLFLLSLIEQVVLLSPDLLQLVVLCLYLVLLGFYHLALGTLIGGILADEPQTAVHLGKVLGAEDEHQLVLYGAVAGHIPHRLYVFGLAVLQLLLERRELVLEQLYVSVDVGNVFLYSVDRLLPLVDFAVYHHQVVEPLLYVGLIGTQEALLLLYLALNARALVAESPDRGVRIVGSLGRLLRAALLHHALRRGLFLGCLLFLSQRRCHQRQCQQKY